jgi:hypothetical protein
MVSHMPKYLTCTIITLSLALSFVCSEGFSVQKPHYDHITLSQVRTLINKRITEGGSPLNITIRGELIYSSFMLETFYKRRNFQPAWVLNDIRLLQAYYLVDTIEGAYLEGLTPDHYHLRTIKALFTEVQENMSNKAPQDPETLFDLDLLLTDAFLLLGCHFSDKTGKCGCRSCP